MITLILNLLIIKNIYGNKIYFKYILYFVLYIILIFPVKIGIQNINHLDALVGINLTTNTGSKSLSLVDVLLPDEIVSYKINISDKSDSFYFIELIKFTLDATLGRINQAHIMGLISDNFFYKLSNSEIIPELDVIK